MDLDTTVKLAIYTITAETGRVPRVPSVADRIAASPDAVRAAFTRLRASRLLYLEADGVTIRMAPPFSGIPTQHRVVSGGIEYYANCAWDALGVVAALHRPGTVHSECAESREALRLQVGPTGPEPSAWLFHCLVPASKWWDDLVFT